MTDEELEKKAEEYSNISTYTEYPNYSLAENIDISSNIKLAFLAGAKEMQEETLKEIIEIEKVSDYRWEENQQLKQQIEKMQCCTNCGNQRNMCLPKSKKLYCSNWRLAE